MHIYTRELLDKHLLPELKEIALGLGITPAGNKTRRETWIAALAGQPFPLFESIAPWSRSKNSSIPIAPWSLKSRLTKIPPVSIVERSLESRPASRRRELPGAKTLPVSFAPSRLRNPPGRKLSKKWAKARSPLRPKIPSVSKSSKPKRRLETPPVSIAPIRRSNSPIGNLHSHSKCGTPGAKSETAGTCPIAIWSYWQSKRHFTCWKTQSLPGSQVSSRRLPGCLLSLSPEDGFSAWEPWSGVLKSSDTSGNGWLLRTGLWRSYFGRHHYQSDNNLFSQRHTLDLVSSPIRWPDRYLASGLGQCSVERLKAACWRWCDVAVPFVPSLLLSPCDRMQSEDLASYHHKTQSNQ